MLVCSACPRSTICTKWPMNWPIRHAASAHAPNSRSWSGPCRNCRNAAAPSLSRPASINCRIATSPCALAFQRARWKRNCAPAWNIAARTRGAISSNASVPAPEKRLNSMTEQYEVEDDMSVIQQEAQAWVVRLDTGQVSERDAQVFRHWCARSRAHASAFAEARAVWRAMAPAARAVQRAQQKPPVRLARRAFLGGAVAASLGLLVLRPPLDIWPAVAGLGADYATGTGEQREVALDGGVLVQMNTQTRLDAAPLQDGAAALVLLAGEAEFQAGLRGAARVRVQAGDGTVSAGSARFNIRLFGQEVCVTCLAGRLRVAQAGNDAELAAGQQLRYRPEHFGIARAVAKSEVSAWRQRLLVFKQSTLAEVVDEVNRYRPGKLILNGDALKQTRVQASFSLDRLDDVIALIQDAYGARVTRLPGGIVLFG